MNRKVNQVLEGAASSDIMKYFEDMDRMIEANGGVGDAKTLTIDASDPPCPRPNGQFTKIKITDDAIHITNIDKSSIGMRITLKILPENDFWSEILESEPYDQTEYDSTEVENIQKANEVRKNIAFAKHYRNKIIKWFVGFKSAIHAIESYRVFSDLKKTNCEQAEAIYETAAARMLKPQEELEHKPQIHTLWKNANAGNDCICGTYFTLEELMKARALNKSLDVSFECTIPLDDFLPFSAMTMFPNKVFENLMMEIKLGLTSSIVLCQVDPLEEFKTLMKKRIGGSPEAEHALYTHLQMDVPNYARRFTQMGDPFLSTIYKINDDQTIDNVTVATKFICNEGTLEWARSTINGFNIKDSLLTMLKEKYREKPLIIPAQICDFMGFGQLPTQTGLKCNCTYGLTNVSSIMFLFPRTGNEITCSENPHMHSIQLQIDSKPYPDKTMGTLEPAHTMFNLTNAGLDSLFSPNEEFAYSLVYNEMCVDPAVTANNLLTDQGQLDLSGPELQKETKLNFPYQDNTSYCFVVSTERLGGYGNFCDGLTRDNCQITLSATLMGKWNENPYYLNPIYFHEIMQKHVVENKAPPKMIICQDCFWEFRTGYTARWVANDKYYYDDMTTDQDIITIQSDPFFRQPFQQSKATRNDVRHMDAELARVTGDLYGERSGYRHGLHKDYSNFRFGDKK